MIANTKEIRKMIRQTGLDLYGTWTELRGIGNSRYVRYGIRGDYDTHKNNVELAMLLRGYANKWRVTKGGYLSFNTWLK